MAGGNRGAWWPVALVALGALVLSTGPLYRVRSWWNYDDPLAADVAVVLAQVAIAACAAGALLRGERWRRVDPWFAGAAVALIAVMALGALWSADSSTTLRESLMVGATLVAGIGAAVAVSERELVAATWVGVHIGLGWSTIAIFTIQPGTQDDNGEWVGVFFNPNSLALVASIGILLSVVAVLQWWGHRARWLVAAVAGAATIADLRLIVGAASLTPLLALGAGVAVAAMAVLVRRSGRLWPGRRITDRTTAALAGVVLLAIVAVLWVGRRVWLPALGRSDDVTGRTAMWDVAIDWFTRRPVAGQGYLGAWSDPDFAADMLEARGQVLGSTHNSFVEVLLGVGLVGLVLFAALFAIVWVAAGERALRGPAIVAAWPLAAITFLVVENLAETLWVGGQITVAMLGVVAVVSRVDDTPHQPPEPRERRAPSGVEGDVVGLEHRS